MEKLAERSREAKVMYCGDYCVYHLTDLTGCRGTYCGQYTCAKIFMFDFGGILFYFEMNITPAYQLFPTATVSMFQEAHEKIQLE